MVMSVLSLTTWQALCIILLTEPPNNSAVKAELQAHFPVGTCVWRPVAWKKPVPIWLTNPRIQTHIWNHNANLDPILLKSISRHVTWQKRWRYLPIPWVWWVSPWQLTVALLPITSPWTSGCAWRQTWECKTKHHRTLPFHGVQPQCPQYPSW